MAALAIIDKALKPNARHTASIQTATKPQQNVHWDAAAVASKLNSEAEQNENHIHKQCQGKLQEHECWLLSGGPGHDVIT